MAKKKKEAYRRPERKRGQPRQIQAPARRPSPWESFGPQAAAIGLQSLAGLGAKSYSNYLKEEGRVAAWHRAQSEVEGTADWRARVMEEGDAQYEADLASAKAEASAKDLRYKAAKEKYAQMIEERQAEAAQERFEGSRRSADAMMALEGPTPPRDPSRVSPVGGPLTWIDRTIPSKGIYGPGVPAADPADPSGSRWVEGQRPGATSPSFSAGPAYAMQVAMLEAGVPRGEILRMVEEARADDKKWLESQNVQGEGVIPSAHWADVATLGPQHTSVSGLKDPQLKLVSDAFGLEEHDVRRGRGTPVSDITGTTRPDVPRPSKDWRSAKPTRKERREDERLKRRITRAERAIEDRPEFDEQEYLNWLGAKTKRPLRTRVGGRGWQDEMKEATPQIVRPTPEGPTAREYPTGPPTTQFKREEVVHSGKQKIADWEEMDAAKRAETLAASRATTLEKQRLIEAPYTEEADPVLKELGGMLADDRLIGKAGDKKSLKAAALYRKNLTRANQLALLRGQFDSISGTVHPDDPHWKDLVHKFLWLTSGKGKGSLSDSISKNKGSGDELIFSTDGYSHGDLSGKAIGKLYKANHKDWHNTWTQEGQGPDQRDRAFVSDSRHKGTNLIHFNKATFGDDWRKKAEEFRQGNAVEDVNGNTVTPQPFVRGKTGEAQRISQAGERIGLSRKADARAEKAAGKKEQPVDPGAKLVTQLNATNTAIANANKILDPKNTQSTGPQKAEARKTLGILNKRRERLESDLEGSQEKKKTTKKKPTADQMKKFREMTPNKQDEAIKLGRKAGLDVSDMEAARSTQKRSESIETQTRMIGTKH